MSAISRVDHLVLLLRQRLQERERAAGTARQPPSESPKSDLTALQALAEIGDVDDQQFRRALVQSLLVEHFGPEMINSGQFQQIVTRVVAALEGEPEARRLLAEVGRDIVAR